MADRVRYIMDRLAPTFRQQADLKIFNQDEIKKIIQRVTDFEYLLKRRQLEVTDFQKYIAYEINLDKLRGIRTHILLRQKEKQAELRNIQTVCIRHICYIFERAIRRFPKEIVLWGDFITFLKSKKLISMLNTVFGRVLALHPKNEDLWIQGAVHEIETNNNADAARKLLQRSLRVNRTSQKLWLRYFELELWYAVRVLERKRILGTETTTFQKTASIAPLVVFRHAVEAIPEPSFAYLLHSSSCDVFDSVATLLEMEITTKYSNDISMWIYLSEKRVCEILDIRDRNNSSRKRKRETYQSLLSTVADALTVTVDTLSRGMIATATSLSATSLETENHLPSDVLSNNKKRLTVDSFALSMVDNLKKIFHYLQFTDVIIEEEEEEEYSGHKKSYLHIPDKLHQAMEEASRLLTDMMASSPGDIPTTTATTTTTTSPSYLTYSAPLIMTLHMFWRLEEGLERTTTTAAAGKAVHPWCSTGNTLLWFEKEAAILKCLPMQLLKATTITTTTTSSAPTSTSSAPTTKVGERLQLWCDVGRMILDSGIKHDLLVTVSTSYQKEDSSIALADSVNLASICWKIVEHADLAVACSDGYDLVSKAVSSLLCAPDLPSIDDLASINTGIQSSSTQKILLAHLLKAITSSYCIPALRGSLCELYLKSCMSLSTLTSTSSSDSSSSAGADDITTADSTSSSDSRSSKHNALVSQQPLASSRVAYMTVRNAIKSKTDLMRDSDLSTFYHTILSYEMQYAINKEMNHQDTSSEYFSFAKEIAAVAVKECPTNTLLFLDILERFERLAGNHKAANHISWRKRSSAAAY